MDRYNLSHIEASFRQFLTAENISPISQKNYLSDLRHFAGWYVRQDNSQVMEGHQVPASIFQTLTASDINAYVDYLHEQKIPHKTINRRLSTIRKFCSFCITMQILSDDPSSSIPNVNAVPHTRRLIQGYIGRLRSDVINKGDTAGDIEEFLSFID